MWQNRGNCVYHQVSWYWVMCAPGQTRSHESLQCHHCSSSYSCLPNAKTECSQQISGKKQIFKVGYKTFSTNILLAMYFCFILDIEFIVTTFFCLKFYWFNIKWHFISYSLISRKNGNTVQKKFFAKSMSQRNTWTTKLTLSSYLTCLTMRTTFTESKRGFDSLEHTNNVYVLHSSSA